MPSQHPNGVFYFKLDDPADELREISAGALEVMQRQGSDVRFSDGKEFCLSFLAHREQNVSSSTRNAEATARLDGTPHHRTPKTIGPSEDRNV